MWMEVLLDFPYFSVILIFRIIAEVLLLIFNWQECCFSQICLLLSFLHCPCSLIFFNDMWPKCFKSFLCYKFFFNDFTTSFQNLGIIHIAKRDTREIIMQRKREELMAHARLRKPHCTYDEIRRSITPTDLKRVRCTAKVDLCSRFTEKDISH